MFREALPSDFAAITHLYHQLNPDDPLVIDGSDLETFNYISNAHYLHLFVLEIDGVVVATTYLNVITNLTRSASPYAVIENVVVEESCRGSGVGRQIMAHTIDAAWRAGCYKAMLLTGSKSESVHGFYRACGFSPDDKQAYVARPDS